MRNLRLSLLLPILLVLSTPANAVMAQEDPSTCQLTIVYDNYSFTPGLETDWGFACFIEGFEKSVLFDSGASGSHLLSNLEQAGIGTSSIDAIVLSHRHDDHIGGIFSLAESGNLYDVYCTSSTFGILSGTLPSDISLNESCGRHEICPGVWTSGEFSGPVIEQALVLQTAHGLVVLTGCAHPGIVRIAEAVSAMYPEETIHLLVGGFHLLSNSASSLRSIANQLHDLGVEQVAPTHCSGALARIIFAEIFEDRYHAAGVGWTIELALK